MSEGAGNVWETLDPGFFAPVWLLVGALALFATILLELGTRRWRREALHQFTAPHLLAGLLASVSGPRRLAKTGLRLLALALLFVALARPHLFYEWREESRNGFDLLFAVDCSKSMLTEDVLPNRLERAKLAIADFADHLRNNRLGLIAFAGDAFLQCPLTLDHSAFDDAVQDLDTDTIPRPGTDVATAIQAAEQALRTQPNHQKIVILVTDGEDLEGRALTEARAAAHDGLKIFTVGVGTTSGGQIPQRDDSGAIQYWHDANGQTVVSRLDEVTLRQIASITGGAYVPLGQSGEGLESIYQNYIAPLPQQHFEEKREKVQYEQFEWPLGLAVLVLVLEFLLGERAATPPPPEITSRGTLRRRRAPTAAVVAGLACSGLLLSSSSLSADAITGQRAYQKGDYPTALKNYRDAAAQQPERSDLQYDRGEAAYRQGSFGEAEEAFRKTLETPNLNLQDKAYYNLGNAQYRHGESLLKGSGQNADGSDRAIELWKQALKSYDAALKLQDSPVARDNYDFVKAKLRDLQKSQAQKQKPSSQNDGGSGSNNASGDSSPPNKGGSPGDPSPDATNDSGAQPNGRSPEEKNTKPPDAAPGLTDDRRNLPGQSRARAVDQADAAARSKQEAEDLLDSLKEDEGHVTARSLNSNEQNPPPASGKDW